MHLIDLIHNYPLLNVTPLSAYQDMMTFLQTLQVADIEYFTTPLSSPYSSFLHQFASPLRRWCSGRAA